MGTSTRARDFGAAVAEPPRRWHHSLARAVLQGAAEPQPGALLSAQAGDMELLFIAYTICDSLNYLRLCTA